MPDLALSDVRSLTITIDLEEAAPIVMVMIALMTSAGAPSMVV